MLSYAFTPCLLLVLFENFAGDHYLLDFGRALVNFRDSGVPVIPLGRHVRHVPHAAQHLHALVRVESRRLGSG